MATRRKQARRHAAAERERLREITTPANVIDLRVDYYTKNFIEKLYGSIEAAKARLGDAFPADRIIDADHIPVRVRKVGPNRSVWEAALPTRTPRRVQIPLLRSAVFTLAKYQGQQQEQGGFSILEVKLQTLLIWITPLGVRTMVDVWDETRGGKKVLGISWTTDGATVIHSFRRGEWEDVLLRTARTCLH